MNKYKLEAPFFALAPMANITTYPFASQAGEYGADLVWTPMVHTDTIINNWPEAEKILDFENIPNYIIQLVGSKPDHFKEAIGIITKHLRPRGIDLNFACPDKNIVKSGCGGAMMNDMDTMVEIVRAMKKSTKLPVSVKTRAGWDNLEDIFLLTDRLVDAGVDMLVIHPRTVKQGFRGEADWNVVARLVSAYPDLLICGSGDVTDWQDAITKQEATGAAGIMIGRSALGKPWIFREIKEKRDCVPTLTEIKGLALDLAVKAHDIWGEKGITESKKHFAWYFRGFSGAQEYRRRLMLASTLEEVKGIIK